MSETKMLETPYKGLVPYSEEDTQFFFGREPEREIITANLMASRLTLLYGESGVGKSSVLRAGVAHHLRQLAQKNLTERGTPELIVVVFNAWRDDPIVGLTNQIQDSVAQALKNQTFEPVPPPSSRTLAEALQTWTERTNSDLLIILDQFEEYFLYHAQEDGDGTFAVEFPRAVNRPGLRASFLVSIREDALAKLDRFKGRIPNLFDNYLRIEHLDRIAAHAAIEKPITAYNRLHQGNGQPVSIEPALVEAVLEQVKTNEVILGGAGRGGVEVRAGQTSAEAHIETPYLQLVMTRLWQEEMTEGSRTLRLETLNKLKGAKHIVRTHVEAVMGTLQPDEQEIAARVFHYLVTPSGTKIAYRASDLAAMAKLDEAELVGVLEKLSGGDVRILSPVDPSPDQPDAPRYEIRHDVLAPAILDWRTRYVQAQERAETERQLSLARRRANRLRLGLVGLVLLLIAMTGLTVFAVQQQVKANRQQEAAERAQRALGQEKAKVEEQRNKAEKALDDTKRAQAETEKEKVRAEDALITAKRAQAEAVEQKDRAEQAQARAEDSADAADTAAREAERQQLRAEGALKVAKSRELTASAVSQLPTDPELSVLLAKEAVKFSPNTQAEDVLRRALLDSHTQTVMRGHGSSLSSAAFSPNGKFIVTASADKTARVWETDTGKLVKELPVRDVESATFNRDGKFILTVGTSDVMVWEADTGKRVSDDLGGGGGEAAFSPDGKSVVAVDAFEEAKMWEASTGEIKTLPPGNIKYRSTVRNRFSPDGRFVFTASRYGKAEVWEARYGHGRSPKVLSKMDLHLKDAALNLDGKLVATVNEDGQAKVWEVATGNMLAELKGEEGPKGVVNTVTFSPNSEFVLTGGADGAVRVWKARTGGSVAILPGKTGDLNGAAFSPDSKFVVTANASDTSQVWEIATGKSVALLRGHTGPVMSAVFSPDGKRVVTASFDGTARTWEWESETWRMKPTIVSGHTGEVKSVAFNLDGKLAVTASQDNVARVWEATTGRILTELRGHAAKVNSVTFSPDGKFAVTASDDKTARLWEVTTGKSVAELKGHTHKVNGAAFSPDGKFIVTASDDGTSQVWETSTGKRTHELKLLGGGRIIAAFSPDGGFIVTAGGNKAQVWNASTGTIVAKLPEHRNFIQVASFSPDGRFVVTTDVYLARVCEVTTGKPIVEVGPEKQSQRVASSARISSIQSAVFSPDSKSVVVVSRTGAPSVWEIATGKPIAELPVMNDKSSENDGIRNVEFSPDGKFIVAAGGELAGGMREVATGKFVTLLNTEKLAVNWRGVASAKYSPDGRFVIATRPGDTVLVWEWQTEKGRSNPVMLRGHSAEFSSDGRLVATASAFDTAHVWETSAQRSLTELRGHTGEITNMAFSRDGKVIITASDDGTAWLWEAATGTNLAVLRGDAGGVTGAAFSFDGKFVVTTINYETAKIWEVATGRRLAVLEGSAGSITGAFSPDGKFIVTTEANGPNGVARVWEVPPLMNTGKGITSLKQNVELRGHLHDLLDAAFNSNGNLIVTTSRDETARMWEWQTEAGRSNPTVLRGHTKSVTSAAFSPDSKLVVTASDDGTARLWEASTGQSLVELIGHTGGVSNAAFSPDGKSIMTVSDGKARIYACKVCGPVTDLLAETERIKRTLTLDERKKYLPDSEDK